MPTAKGRRVAVQVERVELEPVERFVILRVQQPPVADDVEAQQRRGSPQIDEVETMRAKRPLEICPERVRGLFRREDGEIDVFGEGSSAASEPNR